MPEMITIAKEELKHLRERTDKCSMDKSYLQLVIRLMNRVSAASGLEDTVDSMLRNILDVVGGTTIVLYYWIDSAIYSADVYGNKMQLDAIDDTLVQKVQATREPIEVEHDFSDTHMTTPEFGKAYTWVYPLLVGGDLIGVLKMENLHIGVRELYEQLPTFFNYAALVLKNEILGYTRIKQAYDQLSEINARLEQEIGERAQAVEELRQSRDELEERVAERTTEQQSANERLQVELAERKRVEEALLRSEEFLNTIVENIPDMIFVKDADELRFLRFNKAGEELLGYSREELIGKNDYDFFPKDEADFFQANDREVLRNKHPVEIARETILTRSNGERVLHTKKIPIFDQEGRPQHLLGISEDITERVYSEEAIFRLNADLEQRIVGRTNELEMKQLELQESQQALMNIVEDLNLKTEELENANSKLLELDRLKSMFIASMSHELRTPLNSIIGFSSIIRDEWIGPVNPEQKENLDTIQRSGKHLLSLINDVIDVSKIEAGRIEARFEEFDLYDLLTEAVQYVEKDLRGKGLELHLNIDHRPLCSDRRRLLQCVINLLSNAVKFTEHGEVTVSAGSADIGEGPGGGHPSGTASPLIDISIGDSGIGIAEEDIPRLFMAFERLESPLKATVLGTGLGLYLTRKLAVEVLGGDIVCKSEAGRGSTFTLRIPERIYEKGTGSRG